MSSSWYGFQSRCVIQLQIEVRLAVRNSVSVRSFDVAQRFDFGLEFRYRYEFSVWLYGVWFRQISREAVIRNSANGAEFAGGASPTKGDGAP